MAAALKEGSLAAVRHRIALHTRKPFQSMIRKSGNRFSLATNAKLVCAEIMLKQKDEIMMRSIAS